MTQKSWTLYRVRCKGHGTNTDEGLAKESSQLTNPFCPTPELVLFRPPNSPIFSLSFFLAAKPPH